MTTIITRKSVTPGAQPAALEVGELAVNVADATLWTSDGTTVKSVGGSGGGSGDLPTGSAEGQMLRWTATGEATWSVTDVITVTANDNVAIGGPEFSVAYKLTVNGDAYIGGNVVFNSFLATSGQLTQLGLTADPQSGDGATRQSYTEARYAPKSTTVTTNTTQSIGGGKTFTGTLTTTGGGFSVVFGAVAGANNAYVRANASGAIYTSSTIAAADVQIAPGETLAATIAALKVQIIALGGTI